MQETTKPRVKIDGRVKLTPDQKQEIYKKYHDPMYITSQRLLSKEYNVSRRLITFIVHPDKLKAMQEKHKKEQHWKTYYNRKQLTEGMRKWRAKLNADEETKKIHQEYKRVISKRSRDKIGDRECPQCGKVLKALRDHIRRQHESVL